MSKTAAERQRTYRLRREAMIATLPLIPCSCTCGILIPPVNKLGKAARYAHGHNPTPPPPPMGGWNKGLPAPWVIRNRKGKKLVEFTADPVAMMKKRTANRLEHFNGSYTPTESMKAGIAKRPLDWRDNVITSVRNRDLSGPNNPSWKGGVSLLPYGPEFTRRFKRLIRERDGNKCQQCGKTAAQERQTSKRVLSVHHIDHDKTNNDPSNLVTTCNSCNVYFGHHREESLLAFPRRRMLLN